MRNLSDIKHRIKSISDTRKITGAMETISVAKMRKAMNDFESNKAYFETIRSTISDLILYTKDVEHKVFMQSADRHAAVIVIASDKGLAGGYNINLLKFADEFVGKFNSHCVFSVGQICTDHFAAKGATVNSEYACASFAPSVGVASKMGECIYRMYSGGQIDSAYVVFTQMSERGKTEPKSVRLLPFDRNEVVYERNIDESERSLLTDILYEPSPSVVLEYLIPQYLTGMIYGSLIQSTASEHSERRNAMNSATKSANDLLDGLRLEYNRARQESVTGEITEIVTAANGVKDDE